MGRFCYWAGRPQRRPPKRRGGNILSLQVSESTAHESGRRPIADEEQARATCYGLISTLFCAPPNAELLRELGRSGQVSEPVDGADNGWTLVEIDKPSVGGGYPEAYQALTIVCRKADIGSVHDEYRQIFGGPQTALVTSPVSGSAGPNAAELHLVALHEHLVACGLAQRGGVFGVEDHVAAVCDVMRWLIEHDRPLAVQRTFFEEFVYTGLGAFCLAISLNPGTSFYRAVAELARAFLAVECEALGVQTDS